MDLERQKAMGGTPINFRSTVNINQQSTVVNSKLWSTQVWVGSVEFDLVQLGELTQQDRKLPAASVGVFGVRLS